MYPVLIKIGPLTIHTYGVLIAIAFLIGLFFAARQAKKQNVPVDKISDLAFYMLIAAIIGSRLFFVAVNYKFYIQNPFDIIKIWEGGLVFYGGVVFAVITGIWYIKKKSLDLWATADIFAPSVAIAHAIGRLGCFAAGCCYGKVTENLPWAVVFKLPESLAPLNVPLHPTQIYESIGEAVNFVILIILRKHQSFKGQLFWTYLVVYSVIRFTVEFFRGDDARGFVFANASIAQIISAAVFVTAIVMLVRFRKRKLA